jgi:CDP-glucose 4,6-dehydratase
VGRTRCALESLVNVDKLLPEQKNFWMGRRVFVTGARGFVGSWLVDRLLALGAEIVALIRDLDRKSIFYWSGAYKKVTTVNGRLEDFNTVERAIVEGEVDTVFHLAAQPLVEVASRSPLATFESNIRGTYHILEACRLHADLVKRVVVASSDKAYGDQLSLPYKESMPLQGVYPYEVSKSCSDLIAQSYAKSYNLPVVIARCGNIYGGGDLNWNRIVPGTIRSCFFGKPPVLRSDGSYIRDYIYILDVIRAYTLLAENAHRKDILGEAFNFGPEKPVDVLEIVYLIQDLMEARTLKPLIQNTAKGEIQSQYLSYEKAKDLLNWNPTYSLTMGLKETIEWYVSYLGRDEND